jgi:hypothetical protein
VFGFVPLWFCRKWATKLQAQPTVPALSDSSVS